MATRTGRTKTKEVSKSEAPTSPTSPTPTSPTPTSLAPPQAPVLPKVTENKVSSAEPKGWDPKNPFVSHLLILSKKICRWNVNIRVEDLILDGWRVVPTDHPQYRDFVKRQAEPSMCKVNTLMVRPLGSRQYAFVKPPTIFDAYERSLDRLDAVGQVKRTGGGKPVRTGNRSSAPKDPHIPRTEPPEDFPLPQSPISSQFDNKGK